MLAGLEEELGRVVEVEHDSPMCPDDEPWPGMNAEEVPVTVRTPASSTNVPSGSSSRLSVCRPRVRHLAVSHDAAVCEVVDPSLAVSGNEDREPARSGAARRRFGRERDGHVETDGWSAAAVPGSASISTRDERETRRVVRFIGDLLRTAPVARERSSAEERAGGVSPATCGSVARPDRRVWPSGRRGASNRPRAALATRARPKPPTAPIPAAPQSKPSSRTSTMTGVGSPG